MAKRKAKTMTADEARLQVERSKASLSAERILEYWLTRTSPTMAYQLAMASFSNNEVYNSLKKAMGYVC